MNNNQEKFLNYLSKPLSKASIMMTYDAHSIVHDKCELYGDFIMSFLRIVFDTYMGDEITNEVQRHQHFDWCWDENVRRFELEGVLIDNYMLKDYFSDFMYEFYYKSTKKKEEAYEMGCMRVWQDIFDYNKLKSKSELETFLEVYGLFEKSKKTLF
jgi:hypothetical protein